MGGGRVWKLTGENLSTLKVGVLDYATQLHFKQKQPNLKLKTRQKQRLGFPPSAFALPGLVH